MERTECVLAFDDLNEELRIFPCSKQQGMEKFHQLASKRRKTKCLSRLCLLFLAKRADTSMIQPILAARRIRESLRLPMTLIEDLPDTILAMLDSLLTMKFLASTKITGRIQGQLSFLPV